MKKYIELSVLSLNLVAFAAALTKSISVDRIVEVTKDADDNSEVLVDSEGRDLSLYVADHTIDAVLALLPSEQFVKVTVKTKNEHDYASGSEPVKLLNLKRVIYFEASGADDTKILYYNNGFAVVSYIVNETYAAFKTAIANAKELAADGTVALPGLSFASDPDTGLYRISANVIGVTVGGVKVGQFDSTGLAVAGTLQTTGVHVVGAGATTADATVVGAVGQVIIDTVLAGEGIRIPVTPLGAAQVIANYGANAVNIYPTTGANFQGEAADVAIALAAGKKAIVVRDAVTATIFHYLLFA